MSAAAALCPSTLATAKTLSVNRWACSHTSCCSRLVTSLLLPTWCCSEKVSSALFFRYNTQLGPPYQVLVDTNFINFSIKNKVRWGWGRTPRV